jgi:hypothetical protein
VMARGAHVEGIANALLRVKRPNLQPGDVFAF